MEGIGDSGGISGPSDIGGGTREVSGPSAGESLSGADKAEIGRAMDAAPADAIQKEGRAIAGNETGDAFERAAGETKADPKLDATADPKAELTNVAAKETPLNREQLIRDFDPVEGGKHLQSHAQRDRDFSEFKDLRTQAERQTAAQRVVEDILRDPKTAERPNGARFGNGSDFYSPDGRAVRFDGNGKFVGFLDTGANGGAPRTAVNPTEATPKATPQPIEEPSMLGRFGRAMQGLGRLGGRLIGPLGTYLMFRDFQRQMDQMQQPNRDLEA